MSLFNNFSSRRVYAIPLLIALVAIAVLLWLGPDRYKEQNEIVSTNSQTVTAKPSSIITRQTVTPPRNAAFTSLAAYPTNITDADWLKLFQEMIDQSPENAAQWALTHAPFNLRDRAVKLALQSWMQTDPAGACAFAKEKIKGGGLRLDMLHLLTKHWLETGTADCLTWLKGLDNTVDRSLISNRLLDDKDTLPKTTAWELIQLMENGKTRGSKLSLLAEDWGKADLQGALAWLASLSGSDKLTAASELLPLWARVDPQAAIQFASTLGSDLTTSLRQDIAREWALQDVAGVLSWADRLEDEATKTKFKMIAIASYAMVDPRKAAELSRTLPSLKDQIESAGSIAVQWAKSEPRDASSWVEKFPASDAKDKALISIAEVWARNEPEEALQWISGLADTTQRDKLLSEYVNSIESARPDAAAKAALNITREEERLRRLGNAYARWYDMAPSEASAWLSTSGLPDSVRTRLTEFAKGGPP